MHDLSPRDLFPMDHPEYAEKKMLSAKGEQEVYENHAEAIAQAAEIEKATEEIVGLGSQTPAQDGAAAVVAVWADKFAQDAVLATVVAAKETVRLLTRFVHLPLIVVMLLYVRKTLRLLADATTPDQRRELHRQIVVKLHNKILLFAFTNLWTGLRNRPIGNTGHRRETYVWLSWKYRKQRFPFGAGYSRRYVGDDGERGAWEKPRRLL